MAVFPHNFLWTLKFQLPIIFTHHKYYSDYIYSEFFQPFKNVKKKQTPKRQQQKAHKKPKTKQNKNIPSSWAVQKQSMGQI